MVTLVKDPFLKKNNKGPIVSAPEPDFSAVSVNGIAITEAQIMAEAQQHPADTPGQALMAAARALVVRELLLQHARAQNCVVEPMVLPNGSIETQEDALIRYLIESEVSAPASDRQVRNRYYERHKHRFKSDTICEARHILLAIREGDEKDAKRSLAKSLIEKLTNNPDRFSAIAGELSDCPSAMEGGNLGQLTTGSTVAEFEQVLGKMKPGQIWPEPVESRFGFHIIHLINKIPGTVLPFDMVEEKIGAWLEASSWSRAVAQYISILAGNADITGIEIRSSESPLVQ